MPLIPAGVALEETLAGTLATESDHPALDGIRGYFTLGVSMSKPKPEEGPDENGYYHCESVSCWSKHCDNCIKERNALRAKASQEHSEKREWIRNNVKLS